MRWEVIKSFTDINDGTKYTVGDRYPHRGFPSKLRIEQLSTSNNKRGVPLIKSVETVKENTDIPVKIEAKAETKIYTKTDINSMKVAELRRLAKEQDIDDVDNISGNELKTILIDKLGL